MNKLLLFGLVFTVIIVLGCCGNVPTASSTQNFSNPQINASSSTGLEASSNNLDPEILITKNLDEVILTRDDMSSLWQGKNSWGNFTYGLYYKHQILPDAIGSILGAPHGDPNNWGNETEFETLSANAKRYTIDIEIIKTVSIESAKNEFTYNRNDLASSHYIQKIADTINVGNEMVTAEENCCTMVSDYRWTYTVLFRRNNVIVIASTKQAISVDRTIIPGLEKELGDYAIKIDNNLQ